MSYSRFYARFYSIRQKIGFSLGSIWHFYFNRVYLLLLLGWQVLVWLQALLIFRNLSGNILVLHNNVDFGVDLVGSPNRIFLYPLLGLGLSLMNLVVLAVLIKARDAKIFSHLLLGAANLLGLFLSLALMSIYLINFR